MAHKIIISNAMRSALTSPEVQEELTIAQRDKCLCIINGCAAGEETDEQFRYLTRAMNKAFCIED